MSTLTFDQISIDDAIVKGLKDVGYTEPTPLQKSVIPIALEDNDLIVKARSGMGKNGSFIIPVLQRLAKSPDKKGTRALILTPEVDSARKIDEMIWAIGYHAQIESAVVDMKGDEEEQTQAVKEEPTVLVANPGRLEHILSNNRLVLKDVEILVIDEAETIEKIGIISQVKQILKRVSGKPQTLFYSAKFSEDIKKLAKFPVRGEAIYIGFDVFKDVEELDDVESMGLEKEERENGHEDKEKPDKVESSKDQKQKSGSQQKNKDNKSSKDSGKADDFAPPYLKKIKQGYIHIPGRAKISTLMNQLEKSTEGPTVIFTASKRGTDRLYKVLRKNNKNVTSVFGKLSKKKKDERLEGFREGNYNYLVVADLHANELGVDEVQQVINYDVPNEVKVYVERSGLVTTGGNGLVISLVSKQDQDDINEIKDKVSPTPDEWKLPEEVRKKKDRKKGSGKSRKDKRGKDKRQRPKRGSKKKGKKTRKGDDLQLPQPNYDKLSGGRQGKEKDKDKESGGLFGFVKKLFD